jgi:hypothetical protein
MKHTNNIYYLKKFRKSANKKYKLIHYHKDKYYVGRIVTEGIVFPLTGNLSYEKAIAELKKFRRKHVLCLVDNAKTARGKIVKGV